MKLVLPFNVVAANSLPRLFGIGCAAAYLVLSGCSTSGIPKAGANYREPAATQTEDPAGSIEQEIQDQRDWYQMRS